MFAGHDWMLSMSENGESFFFFFYDFSNPDDGMRRRGDPQPRPGRPLTRDLPHGVEDFQFLRVERRHVVVLIAVGRRAKMKKKFKKRSRVPREEKPSTKTGGSCAHPSIPVTRKCRLPWILVQFTKLSMLRASTVCLVGLPVP